MRSQYRYRKNFWFFFFYFIIFVCIICIPAIVFRWVGNLPKNSTLIEQLKQQGHIRSSVVEKAMSLLTRENFVLPDDAAPYDDISRPIGFGATISAPHIHAICAELLESRLDPCSKVLDVGSGSGYFTTLIAVIMSLKRNSTHLYCGNQKSGKVLGLDHIPEIVDQARGNMLRQSFTSAFLHSSAVEFMVADGRYGFPAGGPYDLIHVGATSKGLPGALLKQLKIGGRMVVPVQKSGSKGQQLMVIDKTGPADWKIKEVRPVEYVPLAAVVEPNQLRELAYVPHIDYDY